MARFDGKVVVVTGAASGIGKATAMRIRASDGAAVACLDVNGSGPRPPRSRDSRRGRQAGWFGCDVSEAADVEKAIARVVADLGAPSVCCNVAGIGKFALVRGAAGRRVPQDHRREPRGDVRRVAGLPAASDRERRLHRQRVVERRALRSAVQRRVLRVEGRGLAADVAMAVEFNRRGVRAQRGRAWRASTRRSPRTSASSKAAIPRST